MNMLYVSSFSKLGIIQTVKLTEYPSDLEAGITQSI
jgi:hypothetical protein